MKNLFCDCKHPTLNDSKDRCLNDGCFRTTKEFFNKVSKENIAYKSETSNEVRFGWDDPNEKEGHCDKCNGVIPVYGRMYCVTGINWCGCERNPYFKLSEIFPPCIMCEKRRGNGLYCSDECKDKHMNGGTTAYAKSLGEKDE